ncbi:Rv3654c family TadE-like protein [Pseudokineococcus basanitobsidens]|uniref:Rv3654c family TadE-like protein n=1 Tax=Pseudokineococcus basanitobsidens TaxID=1926649 RepID=A0ABU8RNQ4_9ACTN
MTSAAPPGHHRRGQGRGPAEGDRTADVPPAGDGMPAGRSARSSSDERGAGTVVVVGLVLVGLLLATATAVLGQAVVARHRATAAADLAALAAADVLLGRATGDACGAAGRTAAAGGARLVGCALGGQEVVVHVVVPVDGVLTAVGPATAAARAGPAGSP